MNKHKKNWKIYLLDGKFWKMTQSFVSEITNKSLENGNFHKAFSCNAISEQKMMTASFKEDQTQQIALNYSIQRFLLIDHSKIGKQGFLLIII
ncbi:hypothetical protein [Enterococcus florum]|uniref:hypothetical protein n=1 Tax=Enterococcus florum TaxID=2480627 RepID=UPI00223E78C9|nr:hypothetical protein [Enterococcus florum]